MAVASFEAASDEEFFTHALTILEGDLALDFPPEHIFDSLLTSISLQDQTTPSANTVSFPLLTQSDPSPVSRAQRISLKSKLYRSRKRDELERLRSTVKTLEVRLAALKERPIHVGTSTLDHFPRIWESMAIQEAECRQAVERENKELRELIELHKQLAAKLDQAIKKVITHVNTNV